MASVNFSALVPKPTGQGTQYFLDCDYSQPTPAGIPVPSFPFLDEGDTTTVQFRQKYECALVSYTPPNLLQPLQGTNLYPFGDANWSDGQAGVSLFERFYGNIPAQRTVHGQSYRYPFQYILETGASISGDQDDLTYTGPSYSLGTFTRNVDSTLIYDYFLLGQESQYPLYAAPVLVQIGNTITVEGESYLGNNPVFSIKNGLLICADTLMLAEDDTYVPYKGAIVARRRRLIVGYNANTFSYTQRSGSGSGSTNPGPGNAGASLVTSGGSTPSSSGAAFHLAPDLSRYLLGNAQSVTLALTGTGTAWDPNTTTFTASAGTLSNVVIADATHATATFVGPTGTAGAQTTVTLTCSDGSRFTFASGGLNNGGTFGVNPGVATVNLTANFSVSNPTGADLWDASTTFACLFSPKNSNYNGSGGTISNVSVNEAGQTATFTYAAPSAAGVVQFQCTTGSAASIQVIHS